MGITVKKKYRLIVYSGGRQNAFINLKANAKIEYGRLWCDVAFG